jgi:hypothetical protein
VCGGGFPIHPALSMIRAGRTGAAPDVIIVGGGAERAALPYSTGVSSQPGGEERKNRLKNTSRSGFISNGGFPVTLYIWWDQMEAPPRRR